MRLYFSTPAWGAGHIELFKTVGLPSLLSSLNLPAIEEPGNCCYFLYTRAQDVAQLGLQTVGAPDSGRDSPGPGAYRTAAQHDVMVRTLCAALTRTMSPRFFCPPIAFGPMARSPGFSGLPMPENRSFI
jgi:hypothetical protein